jgi:NDP-sugar pyrophosphorylase family protein
MTGQKRAKSFPTVGAVILAGGFGTRIKHLYPTVPKPMIEVCGRPFLEWVIRHLASQGVVVFSLSVGYRCEVVEEYLRNRPADGLNIAAVREDAPQGTAGGFLMAARSLPACEAFLIANGDSLVLADLLPVLRSFGEGRADAVIWGRWMEDCSRYGSLECDSSGFLTGFREKRPGKGLINAGIYLVSKKLLGDFPSTVPLSFEHDVFPLLLAKKRRIAVAETHAPFIDIGTPETVGEAESFIRDHFSPQWG